MFTHCNIHICLFLSTCCLHTSLLKHLGLNIKYLSYISKISIFIYRISIDFIRFLSNTYLSNTCMYLVLKGLTMTKVPPYKYYRSDKNTTYKDNTDYSENEFSLFNNHSKNIFQRKWTIAFSECLARKAWNTANVPFIDPILRSRNIFGIKCGSYRRHKGIHVQSANVGIRINIPIRFRIFCVYGHFVCTIRNFKGISWLSLIHI